MADQKPTDGSTADASPARSTPAFGEARKPYARPRILSREPLESMAATCTGAGAKFVGGVGGCQLSQAKS